MRMPAASCVTPKPSRKSSTARLRSFFACCRNATDAVSGIRQPRGEVVDLEALLQEVGVVGGRGVPEQAVRHGLQCHRPQTVTAGDRGRRQVDASVLEVGDRSGRMGEVVDVDQLESELLGHDAHGAVRESALHVSRGLEVLLGELLDLGEVVVLRAHPQPQLGVRAPRLLRCGDGLAFATLQLPVQAEDRFDGLVAHALGHAHGRDAELAEDRALLRAFQGDLESGTAVRRLPGDEIGHLRLGRLGDRLQQRELGLALAVLDQAQLRTGDADESTELVEREPVLQPVVTDAVAESREVDAGGRHSLSVAKELKFLSLEMAESRARTGRR